jgi:hypothetical protein
MENMTKNFTLLKTSLLSLLKLTLLNHAHSTRHKASEHAKMSAIDIGDGVVNNVAP